MSIHLMSLVWKVTFPSQTQKLLMLRMADFAHEDGSGVYPAIDTMASEIGGSRRQTQYAIKALESCDLIKRVTAGGINGRKTNIWEINTELLVHLALKEFLLIGVHDSLQSVENEGAIIAPRDLLRVQSIASRVQSATEKGATGSTQTLTNHHLESSKSASADARDGSRTSPASRSITSLTIEPCDAGWQAWLDHLDNDTRVLAEQRGKIEVSKRWPDASAIVHTKFRDEAGGLTSRSKAMTGEAS